MYKCIADINIDRNEEKRLVDTLSKCIENTVIRETILDNVYEGYTRKPLLYFNKHTSYKTLKKYYYSEKIIPIKKALIDFVASVKIPEIKLTEWDIVIASCVASGGHYNIIKKYLNDEPKAPSTVEILPALAYIAIYNNNYNVIPLLYQHIPIDIISDKMILRSLIRGRMDKNLKTIKKYYELYPHRNIVDDIDFYLIYRSGDINIYKYYEKHINADNVKKIDLDMFLYRNDYYKRGYTSMTDKHMNIFIQLCMNKYIYKNLKNDTLKKIINLIHKKLDLYEKYTQYNMIRMMIKYAKIFKIKKLVYICNDIVYPLYFFALGYYNKYGIFKRKVNRIIL
jgi:hypothetical protein